MVSARRLLLGALPKVLLSRTTGLLTRIPLPRPLRAPAYRTFARRYGADLDEMAGEPADHRSLAAFFGRALAPGARPLADTDLVWPCDGRIVTAGPVRAGRIPQVKGRDYALADLLGDPDLAAGLEEGSQATVYLAPGDYHRVHAPFAGTLRPTRPLPGTLYPVNPPAVRTVPDLFLRNARVVFPFDLDGSTPAAVVMVGAFNVGDLQVTAAPGPLAKGAGLGRFGFGSTVVALVGPGGPRFATPAPETPVRQGAAATGEQP